MTDIRYLIFAGADNSRRVFHGSLGAAMRAATRARDDDPFRQEAAYNDVTEQVAAALSLLESSGEPELVEVAAEGRFKHGWLNGEALYAALCGAAVEAFQEFEPENEDWGPEFWGWRWGNIGIADDLVECTCERIAQLVLRPEEVAKRVWPK